MKTNERIKNERVEIRINTKRKNTIIKAMQYSGAKSVSEFMLEAAYLKAIAVIENEERILSSEHDKKVFFKALFEDTQQPAPALVALADEYNKAKSL